MGGKIVADQIIEISKHGSALIVVTMGGARIVYKFGIDDFNATVITGRHVHQRPDGILRRDGGGQA